MRPGSGLDAATPEAFELLRFAVNGEVKRIRRATRKGAQICTDSIGADHVAGGEAVTISYTYRTVTRQAGHLLFFDIEQPTRNLRVELDYTGCNFDSIAALDLISDCPADQNRANTCRPSRRTDSNRCRRLGLPEVGHRVCVDAAIRRQVFETERAGNRVNV